jgi:uncharacterized protein with von Willebrand factor type A (vWA) domain
VTSTPQPASAAALPLLGMFQRLIERGAALGGRDYLDGLRALEAGYGGCDPARLRRLAVILWARTDEDHRTIDQWFKAITPWPDAALVDLNEQLRQLEDRPQSQQPGPQSKPSAPGAPAPVAAKPGVADAATPQDDPATPRARLAIAPASTGQGLGLPRLEANPPLLGTYGLQPRPVLQMRQLALLWRRLRRNQRLGVKQELDLQASLRARCELGVLLRPVLRPCRSNTAKLLILADASPSMAPWLPFLKVLEASLAHGRLGDADLRWFVNVPGTTLQVAAPLQAAARQKSQRESQLELLRRFAGGTVLVLSDAGSARGLQSRRRVRHTKAFLDTAAHWGMQVVWINPMPAQRWSGSSAAQIEREGPVLMLPLDGANLARAVDYLRGAS